MDHDVHMRSAIAEARRAMGSTHPNPAVGAVIIHGEDQVCAGYTQPAGRDHAEVVALKAFADTGIQPDASTCLYVTMEPCSTTGHTPPCTDAIIASGIRRVVVGCNDPNPAHSGRGLGILRDSGLEVVEGVLEEECSDLNLIFNWRMREGCPLFAAKIATTIDGRIATRGGSSKWITGPMARADVHQWRHYFPAIAVGAGTILADDPSLTVRCDEPEVSCGTRFIFDRNLITFGDTLPKVYTDAWVKHTIVVTDRSQEDNVRQLEQAYGVQFWMLEDAESKDGLSEFSQRCHSSGIDGVYFEGGARLLSVFLQHRFLHYLFAYRAPKLLADTNGLAPFMGQNPVSMEQAIHLRDVRQTSFGDDQLMRGFIVYPDGDRGLD